MALSFYPFVVVRSLVRSSSICRNESSCATTARWRSFASEFEPRGRFGGAARRPHLRRSPMEKANPRTAAMRRSRDRRRW